jgi:hypothetical protein
MKKAGPALLRLMFGSLRRAVVTFGLILGLVVVASEGNAPRTPSPAQQPAQSTGVQAIPTLPPVAAPGFWPTPEQTEVPLIVITAAPGMSFPGFFETAASPTPDGFPAVQPQPTALPPVVLPEFIPEDKLPSYMGAWQREDCALWAYQRDQSGLVDLPGPVGCFGPDGLPLGQSKFVQKSCWYRETREMVLPGALAPAQNPTIQCDPYGSGRWVDR